ncbi:hypothetical protein AB3662_05335 [Sorangium cellulosum]|uniref:hypothetical protein n=1 Tax=Sorangium cellulosum TaxID=56 RepID=UPI003D9A6F8F
MKPRLFEHELLAGYRLFSTRDPREWKSCLEDLGKLCAEAWRDDLSEEKDRTWAGAHRDKFKQWLDGRLAPPWPMLIAAVKRAFLASRASLEREPTSEAERLARLDRTHLWKTLTADDVAQGHGPEALRAFQRGFRLGRRRRTGPMKNIPQVVDPPIYWGGTLNSVNLPGPSAARNRTLLVQWRDGKDLEAVKQALRELYASAWREDVPEEDRAWAEAYREMCTSWVTDHRRGAVAQSAYEAYLQNSDGILDGEPAPPWPGRWHHDARPWLAFAERVEDAPEDESELATAEAAAREYWDARWREAPPWYSDPAQTHWLAAVRAARRTSAALASFVPRPW